MKKQTWLLLAVLLYMVPAQRAKAEGPPLELRWNELESRIAGKKVSMVLTDGVAIEGRDAGVEAGGLRLNITKSGDKKLHPKGVQVLPRELVTFLEVTEYRHLARIIVPVAAVATVAAVTVSMESGISEGAGLIAVPVAGAAGGVGAAVGGYYAGKAIDKRVTQIRVVPGK